MPRYLTVLAALTIGPATAAAQQQWWQNAVCYEVFVRSYYDSDGDGVGDLRGLTERLPYINELGANCIWLMPVAQSPSYHGYDVTNYYEIDRDYGTSADFRRFVAEAHRLNIRVVVDLVLNHMSSEHPFFQSAVLDRNSPYRDWFLWSPVQRRTLGWQAATWHRVPSRSREEYYYGIFWHGMPDLNLANPAVTNEWKNVARYWLEEMGVDGFRLDAVGHFFEDGDDPRNGRGTHPWLRDFAAYIRSVKPGAFTVGEVWDSIGAMRPYYPDQLDSYFTFAVADSLIAAVRAGSARGLLAALESAQRYLPAGRWASFQRNHDQTRTLTDLGGDTLRARLAASLLLTLPGIPFIYYGEEIGMTGDKRDGDPRLRTPMQWSRSHGGGFTRGQPWIPLSADSFAATVADQEGQPGSLLNLYRRLIRLRLSRPELAAAAPWAPFNSGSDSVLAFTRGEGGRLLVIANLTGTRRAGPAVPARARVIFGRERTRSFSLEPFELVVLELR